MAEFGCVVGNDGREMNACFRVALCAILMVGSGIRGGATDTPSSSTTASTATTTTPNGTIYIPISDGSLDNKNNVTISSLTGFPRHAYRVDVTASVTVLTPSTNKGLVKASKQAKQASCVAAINGGPFHADGSSVGVLVTNGVVRQTDANAAQLVGVGLVVAENGNDESINNNETMAHARDSNNSKRYSWILGAPPLSLRNVQFFVTGFDWLVYQGVNVVDAAGVDTSTGAVRAPRTAVGVAGEQLVFVVADGCERWYVIRHRKTHTQGGLLNECRPKPAMSCSNRLPIYFFFATVCTSVA